MAQSSDSTLSGWQAESGEERFQSLFRRYYRPILVFFRRRGFSAEIAEDLAQETFVRAHRGMSNFRGDAASLASWVFAIAAHVSHNELRRLKTIKRDAEAISLDALLGAENIAEDDPVALRIARDEGPGGLEDLLARERAELLARALAELPPQMRLCVMLRLRDLKYREIAEVTGISIQAVRSHLYEARKRLKSRLAHQLPDLESG